MKIRKRKGNPGLRAMSPDALFGEGVASQVMPVQMEINRLMHQMASMMVDRPVPDAEIDQMAVGAADDAEKVF